MLKVVDGFFDIAKLVASEGKTNKTPYEDLAYKLGTEVYADFQGWKLYLKDMGSGVDKFKMNELLANLLGPQVTSGNIDERAVEDVLRKMPVVLGKGKRVLPLWDLIPATNYRDLVDILKESGRGR